ncbi:GIN domain-containing protein [Archangium violaceum]|uniref:GIN domain-containing protein n=1 Tax=Archangium violaceum TaxID=83451 RepID=UPI0036DB9020
MWKMLGAGVASVVLSGCFFIGGEDAGPTQTRERSVGNFSRVENRTSAAVVVNESEVHGLSVTIGANLQDDITTHVESGTLIIDSRGFWGSLEDGSVRVSLPRFLGATQAGSGSIAVQEIKRTEDLELSTTGSGWLGYCGPARTLSGVLTGSGQLNLCNRPGEVPDSVYLSVTGSGELTYAGTALRVDAFNDSSGEMSLRGEANTFVGRVRGSGNVDARNFVAKDVELTNGGSGNLLSSVLDEGTVKVTLTGSGNIELWGDATVREQTKTGSGQFIRH